MSTAPKFIPNYTVADYQQWDGDWELWQGIPVAMTPSPFGRHQWYSLRLATALLTTIQANGCDAEVLQEIDWIVSDDTVVRPDVIVVCDGIPEGHVINTPTLVAEILSPSTAERDQTDKRRLYEELEVDYYLIIDPDANSMLALERGADGKLQQLDCSESLRLSLCEDCEIDLPASAILKA